MSRSLRSILIGLSERGNSGDPRPLGGRIKRVTCSCLLKVIGIESGSPEPPDKDISPWSTLMEDIKKGHLPKCPRRSLSRQNRLPAPWRDSRGMMLLPQNRHFHIRTWLYNVRVRLIRYRSVVNHPKWCWRTAASASDDLFLWKSFESSIAALIGIIIRGEASLLLIFFNERIYLLLNIGLNFSV